MVMTASHMPPVKRVRMTQIVLWLPLTRRPAELLLGPRERKALTTPPSAAKPHPPPLTRGGKGLIRFVFAPTVEPGVYFTPKGGQ